MLLTWEARTVDRVQSGGRTHPLVIECAHASEGIEERKLIHTKALGLPEVTTFGLFGEVFAPLLAKDLGVITPEPALVSLSQAVIDQAHNQLRPYGLTPSPGTCAGSHYCRPGFTEVTADTYLPATSREQAARLYAFDMLIQNPDRRRDKPNCGLFNGNLIAFDHETAFSFVLSIGTTNEAWEVTKYGFAHHHLFYKDFRRIKPDFRPFIDDLKKLTQKQLDEMLDEIPVEWRANDDKICRHITGIISMADKFHLELIGSLT